jgi:hypothetical protein
MVQPQGTTPQAMQSQAVRTVLQAESVAAQQFPTAPFQLRTTPLPEGPQPRTEAPGF